ncbi:MAG: hypothetical protein D8M58_18330 [Calditrichaeota bacterium]|nr:MAG: hypothetical protein DWQ03_11560 [Calditrichota bacterium]MBL1207368.1 hypothetical protein [Calditrichota bacterium]NOG47200.1 hypothetical protein [Calditrichota bacterium]
MRSVRLKVVVLSLFTILFLAGCGAITKMTGSLVGSLLTKSTDNLNNAAIQVYFMRNVYPKATNVVEVDYMGESWQENGNMVFVSFLNRDGMGMLTVDGTVEIDGEIVPHVKNGFYGKWIGKDDLSPKHVVIKTKTGQTAEFTVSAPEPIKIKSVNGKSSGAEINVEKDLVLELESPNTNKNTEIKIGMINSIMGMLAFTDAGVFKYDDKLTIPAVMWENTGSGMSPKEGENWLKVERFNVIPTNVKGVGASQVIGMSLDCVPVNVTGEIDENIFGTSSNYGLRVTEEFETENGKLNIDISKPTAFLGRPMKSGKKFAMASFTVRATKLQQSRTDVSHTMTHKITTTTTKTFPKLPDSYWENLVNGLYADFEKVLNNNYDMELIPISDVLKAPSYSRLEPISDNVSVVEVEKSYKGTKNLIPTTVSAIVDNISTTFASDRVDARLIKELGVDGLIAVTLDLEMNWETAALSPRMSIRISGAPNGYIAGPTIYLQGVITGQGVDWDEARMEANYVMEALPNTIRQKDLMKALDTAFKKMYAAEKEKGYDALWAIK